MANADGYFLRSDAVRCRQRSLYLKYLPEVYDALHFAEDIKAVNVNVKDVDLYKKTMFGSDSDRDDVQRQLDQFKNTLVERTVKFEGGVGLSQLIFDDKGHVHSQIRGFLEKKKVIYHLEIFKDKQGNPCCCIRSRDRATCNKVYDHVEKAFDRHELGAKQVQNSKQLSEFINQWETKKKLKVIKQTSDTLVIYCTNDISMEFLKHISERTEIVPLPEHYFVFLDINAQDLLQDKSKKFGVRIGLDPTNNTMSIQGGEENIEDYKEYLTSAIQKEYIVLPNFSNAEVLSSAFDRIASRHGCTWSKCTLDQSGTTRVEGCDYLTTMYHPTQPGTLSCITGSISTLKVDCMVLFMTDTNVLLHDFSGNDKSMQKMFVPNPQQSNMLLDCIHRTTNDKPFGNVLGLVLELANEREQYAKSLGFMDKVLETVTKHNFKTVCLSVSAMKGRCASEDIVKSFVDALIKNKWEEKNVQFCLCFDESQLSKWKGIDDEITKRYKMAKRGFSRKPFKEPWEDIAQAMLSDQTMDVHVERCSLQEVTTEAIVNTTRVDLQLEKGFVSSSLLKAAGEEMKSYCSKNYPNGISLDQVAVTPPFKLKDSNKNLKVVVHGALSVFNVSTYQEGIKRFMRLCLLKADERGCRSVAFPALGTGNHGNPNRETIKVMVDACIEYRDEMLGSGLNTVVFALPDDDSYKVFQGEKLRTEEARTFISYLPRNHDCVFLEGVYKKKPNETSILVVKDSNVEEIPPYTVDVSFRQDMSERCQFKYSCEDPKTALDQLDVKLESVTNSDCETVKSTLNNCLEFCRSRRFTEISLTKIKRTYQRLNTKEYYQTVVEAIPNCLKSSNEPWYIHRVYIKVTDQEFEQLERNFLQSNSSYLGFLLTSLGSQFEWRKHIGSISRKPVYVQILGKSREDVCRVKNEISMEPKGNATLEPMEEISGGIHRDNDALGARPKLATPTEQGQDATPDNMSSSDGEGDDVNPQLETIFHGNVSAEMNQGFISFKRKYNDLDKWIARVQNALKVTITCKQKPDELWKVEGKYEHIAAFKRYLDEYFPHDPSKEMVADIFVTVKAEIKRIFVDVPQHAKLYEMFIEMDEHDASALTHFYKCSVVPGVKKWEFDVKRKALCVTYQTHDVDNLKDDIKSKLATLIKEEFGFDDLNDFLVFDSGVVKANEEGMKDGIYYTVVPQDAKVFVYGRSKESVQKAVDSLKAQYKGKTFGEEAGGNEHGYGTFILENNKVKFKIYYGDIKALSVDAIAIPASKTVNKTQGLQKIIIDAAGQAVAQEYRSYLAHAKQLQGGECMKTAAGHLRYNHLFHVYLPKNKKIRDNQIAQINMLEEVLIKCFKAADTEHDGSIGVPFIGTGNAGYDLNICVQQYFRAVTSKEWNPNHLQEIHFVSNNEHQVQAAIQIFKGCLEGGHVDGKMLESDDHVQGSPIVNFQNEPFCIGTSGRVKLYVAEGSVTAVDVDAIACRQNKYFTVNHGVVKDIYNMCGKAGQDRLDEEKCKAHEERAVHEVFPGDGVDLRCKKILYAVLPTNLRNRDDHEETLEESTFRILERASNRQYASVALPLLGLEDDYDEASADVICKAMIKGIFKHAYRNGDPVRVIHVLDRRRCVVDQFRRCVNYIRSLSSQGQHNEMDLSGRKQNVTRPKSGPYRN